MENSIKKVREIALNYLYKELIPAKIPPLVYHPVFTTWIYATEKGKVVDMSTDLEGKAEIIADFVEKINSAEDVARIMHLLRTPYWLMFLRDIKKYISKSTFSKLLSEAYISSENPNDDPDVPVDMLEMWFQEADKKQLMEPEEYAVYQKLPDALTVYRGVGVGRVEDGLSWTQHKLGAIWFSNRFNKEDEQGIVLEAHIGKEDVLAYFSRRGEEEIVCRPALYKVIDV